MAYVCPIEDLEKQLKEAGEQLAFPPSSTMELLELLDKTEQLLTFVAQEPSIPMQGALVPLMGALIADGLIKHSEINVRVSVASCLCEVTRITAPEPPYKDEIMKEIFQLNVLAVGLLSNVNGQSYRKATHIVESVAKVKSCLLMLDLECDALVLEMFELFLSEIRDDHPDTVFSDMEAIMTNLIEQSDEVPTEILSLLISHVKKENQIVTPASCKVAEKVLRNCSDTLRSYSETIMKLVNSNPDDYAEVVTVLCQNGPENDHMVTRSRTNGTHKRGLTTLENNGSTKKQKSANKNQLNGEEMETPRSSRPKKNKNILNDDNAPNSVHNSQEDTRRTRSRDKTKSRTTQGDIGSSGSLYNVVVKTECDTTSDINEAEPFTEQINNNKVQQRRKSCSSKAAVNGSHGKDLPKKYRQDLVGHWIKVWWPMDKRYYEGSVSSYNPSDNKHKIIYADGDEELLNLRHQRWRMVDGISPTRQQDQAGDLTSPVIAPAKRLKGKGKGKEIAVKQEDDSNLPESQPPAVSSKAADETRNA